MPPALKTLPREMIADAADIRFECNKCGQHLVVESAGAGLTADCPICDTSVTVPVQPSGRKARRTEGGNSPEGRHEHKAGATPAPGFLRSPFADPLPGDIREELIDASLINGKLVRDLEKAREEVARLQQQLKVLGEESERLASQSFLFEEFLVREKTAGRFDPAILGLQPIARKTALLHGHCHQKAFRTLRPASGSFQQRA